MYRGNKLIETREIVSPTTSCITSENHRKKCRSQDFFIFTKNKQKQNYITKVGFLRKASSSSINKL